MGAFPRRACAIRAVVVRIRGWAAHRKFSVDAQLIARNDHELSVVTEDGHTALLRPRYAGSTLRPSYPFGHEICSLHWDGEYIAIAGLYEDEQGDITIVPQD